MVADSPLGDIEKLEKDLWEAADQLRANSKLTSSEYCMPVLGVIFLRHAANRFEAATRQIEADQAAGRMPKRPLVQADYVVAARISGTSFHGERGDTISR
jgi:type I restriction enzyme M protein